MFCNKNTLFLMMIQIESVYSVDIWGTHTTQYNIKGLSPEHSII